ncbi:hypothetical protein HRbin36_00726 [bacterium HR36]|nr:hypothetical protein HRbin36_00726 [bacterium HR36]
MARLREEALTQMSRPSVSEPGQAGRWLQVLGLLVWGVAWLALGPAWMVHAQSANSTNSGPVDWQQWLDRLLQFWQREAQRTVKLHAQFEATRKFHNFGGVVKAYQGQGKFMRLPDGTYGFLIELHEKGQADRYERYLCTGTHFYMFRPEEKTIYFHTLPPRKPGEVPDQGPMSFLFGISAEEAKKRYQMAISRQDEWYTYVEIRPHFPKDQVDFVYARLAVLNKPTSVIPQYYPRQIYWVEPQKVEVTWDIVRLMQNEAATQVDRRDFAAPPLPAGWQLKPIQQPNSEPPSVVRPQQ